MDPYDVTRNQLSNVEHVESEYPDPEEHSVSSFPWMTHHSPVPAERLPRPPGSLTFESSVPENEIDDHRSSLQGRYSFDIPSSSNFEAPIEAHYQLHTNNDIESDLEYQENRPDSEDEDQNVSTDEAEVHEIQSESEDDAVYSRTRSRNTGKVGRPRSSPKTRGTKFRGRGGWSKGMRLGPRPALEPSEEFNAVFQDAVNSFIDQQDNDRALDLILKAISINPEIYSAHALLAEIYFARGDAEKAVTTLFAGAHAAPRDSTVWLQVADICLEKSPLDRRTSLEQGSYCLTHVIRLEPNDHESRFRRATIDRELGNYSKAMRDFEFLLKQLPHNSNILRQIAEVSIEMNDVKKAKNYYEQAIDHSKQADVSEEEAFSWSDLNVYVDLISKSSLDGDNVATAVQTLKQLARWLLGRDAESFWDLYEDDDREWDAEDFDRRQQVKEYQPGRFPSDSYGLGLPLELRIKLGLLRLKQGFQAREEALNHFEWLEPGHDEAEDIIHDYADLFLQVAQALSDVKDYAQALRYYEPLRQFGSEMDTNFWIGIATCYYICDKKVQAIECYEMAKTLDEGSGEARTQLSKLYTELGDKEKATYNAREAVLIAEDTVRRTDRRKYERREQRIAREAAEAALRQADKLPGPRVTPQDHSAVLGKTPQILRQLRPAGISAPDLPKLQQLQKPPRKKPVNPNSGEGHRRDSVIQLYTTLTNNTVAMRAGDLVARKIWIDCASSMIDDFRTNRVFYPYERHMQFKGYDRESRNDTFRKKWRKEFDQKIYDTISVQDQSSRNSLDPDQPLPSVESGIPNDYRGILFSTWLDIFLEYAILLANQSGNASKDQCYTIITAALDCVLWYHDPEAMLQIHACYMACALALGDDHTLFNSVIRWFMRQFQFCTDGYRLFAAMNLFFKYPNDKNGKAGQMANSIFRSGPNNKFLFRQIMNLDSQLPEDYDADGEGPVPEFMRQRRKVDAEADPDDETGNLVTSVVKPKEMDVVLLTLYGHILYAAGSFPNALSYFYRALSLDSKNPVVLLSMALSYMHQMFKRQNDNRHMYLLQGWALFERYADSRIESARQKSEQTQKEISQEIEFNRSRCWHMLGMADLAVRGYQKVLEMNGDKSNKENFSMEAAYAMQLVYATNGDTKMARDITEKWLVVE